MQITASPEHIKKEKKKKKNSKVNPQTESHDNSITASPEQSKKEKKKKKKSKEINDTPQTEIQENSQSTVSEDSPKKGKKRKMQESDMQPSNNNVEENGLKIKKRKNKKNEGPAGVTVDSENNKDGCSIKTPNEAQQNGGAGDPALAKPSLLRPSYLSEPVKEPPKFRESSGGRGGGRDRFGGRGGGFGRNGGRDRRGGGRDRHGGRGPGGFRNFGDKNSPNLIALDKNNIELLDKKGSSPEKEAGSDAEGTPIKKSSLLKPDYLTAGNTTPPSYMSMSDDNDGSGGQFGRGGRRFGGGGGGGRRFGGRPGGRGGRPGGRGGRPGGRGGGRRGGRPGGFGAKGVRKDSSNCVPVTLKSD